MEIYDFHSHIYPERVREKAVRSLSEGYDISVGCDGSVDSLLKIGKEAGIGHFVTLAIAMFPVHMESINNFILEEHSKHHELIAFGTVHPAHKDPCGEIERIKELGIKGIKLHPDTQQFEVDTEKMFPVYDLLSQLELPLLIHCGDYRYDYDNPERLGRVLDEFPKLTVIAAHFGGWLLYDRALDILKNRRCYLDCSSSFMYTGKRRGLELVREYGAERIVFGSDYPVWNPKDALEQLLSLGLTENELDCILYKNAKTILEK